MDWLFHPRALRVVRGVSVGLSVVLLALLGYRQLVLGQARSLEDYGAAPTFQLTDHLERPVRSDELRGKVVVANFVYTGCRDTCPLLSVQMQALQERLREQQLLGDRVQLLSFTVDPEHDTPAVLRAYAERHDADPQAWRFLTGPADEVVQVIQGGFFQGVVPLATPVGAHSHPAGTGPHSHGDVMHSNRFVLVDRQGRLRAFYDGLDLDLDQVVRDIRQLLR